MTDAKTAKALAAYDAQLDADMKAISDRLRAVVRAAAPDLEEGFKWNAPSFHRDGVHCITLGRMPKGGIRLVLHRDAKVKNADGFRFDDPDGLAGWPAPDRGTLSFLSMEALDAVAPQLASLIRRWAEAAD